MPLTLKGPRKRAARYSISVLCGLLPILLGVLILYVQAQRTLEQSTEQTAIEAVRQFDLMLDNTALAAQELLPLAGKDCDNAAQLSCASKSRGARSCAQPRCPGKNYLLHLVVWRRPCLGGQPRRLRQWPPVADEWQPGHAQYRAAGVPPGGR